MTDAVRRAAPPIVRLLNLDEPVLLRLLATAIDDADPGDVMAPVAGPPGWTSARREAFLAYHRGRRTWPAQLPIVELTYAVLAGSAVAGALRLAAVAGVPGVAGVAGDPAALEVGLWLGRRHRGRRIGAAALSAGAQVAREIGAHLLVAQTSPANAAALALLRTTGFGVHDVTAARVSASLTLDPLPQPDSP